MFTKQDQRWVFHKDALAQDAGPGVTRRVLAYNSQLMCVENHFEQGAVGPAHSHPHTQITYVASGRFAFTIDGETHEVGPGDTLLKTDGVVHGCTCLEAGVLLDIFNPGRARAGAPFMLSRYPLASWVISSRLSRSILRQGSHT